MNFEDIIYEKTGGVAFVTINRPQTRNAFRDVTLHEMITALTDAWGDGRIGVVVLRGAGGKAFCSGGDLKEKKKGRGREKRWLPRSRGLHLPPSLSNKKHTEAGHSSGKRLRHRRGKHTSVHVRSNYRLRGFYLRAGGTQSRKR